MRVVEPHEFKGVKHPKKKKKHGLKLRLVLVGFVAIYIASIFIQPAGTITATAAVVQPTSTKDVTINWPNRGQAAIGAVGYGILSTHGEQKALPMASVAKVMTALAVLKQKPLKPGEQGPIITITQEDVNYYEKVISEDGSNTPVVVGEEITQYEALQALLLPSSNNMAHTLARWAYGSEKDYLRYVNNFAKSLGMTTANFDDASGYSAKTVASAEDLAKLAVNAMDNPVVAEIAAQQEATIPVAGRIYNVNMLLGRNGIVGVKTGNTEEAGGCFMAAAVRTIGGQKVTAVSVIMGADNLGAALRDSVPLVTSVLDGFEEKTLVKANDVVGSYNPDWGMPIPVRAKDDVKGVLWRGTPNTPEILLDTPSSSKNTLPAQTKVGVVRGSFGRIQTESPILLATELRPPPFTARLKPRFL